jgi:hypothetical protein
LFTTYATTKRRKTFHTTMMSGHSWYPDFEKHSDHDSAASGLSREHGGNLRLLQENG